MNRAVLSTFILAAVSLGQAQQTGTRANVYSLDISPERQELNLQFEADLGFPIGERIGTVELNCTGKAVPEVAAWKEGGLDQYEQDAEGTRAIASKKIVQVTGASATVRAWYGDLKFSCKNRVLYTDFSAIASNPAAQGKVTGTGATFGVQQNATLKTIQISYPLVSTRRSDGAIMPQGLTVNLLSTNGLRGGQKMVKEIYIGSVARGKTEAIFLLDSKTNTLLPLKYAGNDSGTRQVFNKVLSGPLVLYYTPDYTRASGWRKLTVDFTNGLIWTQDVTRPNAKLGN